MRTFRDTREYPGNGGPNSPVIPPQGYGLPNTIPGNVYGQRVGGAGSANNRFTEPQRYPDLNSFNGAIAAAAVSFKALPRSSDTRVHLVIQNLDAANALMVNFGAAATANLGIQVVAQGNLFYDAVVPQNDIFLFSTLGVSNFVIVFANLGF